MTDSSSEEGGDPEIVPSYRQELSRWLQRHKTYPRHLKRRRVEGEVIVAFAIDGDGRLLDSRVVTSSGEPGLDEAALELLARASPFPPLPPSLTRDRYDIDVPILYYLN